VQGSQTRARGAFWEFSNKQHLRCQAPWKRFREIFESNLNDTQCGFRPGRSNTDHILLSSKIFRNLRSTVYKDVYTCFVDLEKAYDLVPCENLSGVLREYGVDGRLLLAAKSLYSCSDVCVRVGRVKSRPFTVGVGVRQGCVLSPLLFIVNISGSQPFRWREPNSDLRICWRTSLKYFNIIKFTRFVLQQNEVCYTKY